MWSRQECEEWENDPPALDQPSRHFLGKREFGVVRDCSMGKFCKKNTLGQLLGFPQPALNPGSLPETTVVLRMLGVALPGRSEVAFG